ncbi:MAG: NADH-quinone oxidoreductase subunit J family protein [Gemmatimonadaceae bacterium]
MTYPLFYTFHFYLFGLIAVASAIAFVTRRSPVAAALWLVATLFSLAAMFVLLDAEFIAAIQILVYAGAIMVVFLFVIMLLNLGQGGAVTDARGLWPRLAAGAVGLVLLTQVLVLARSELPESLFIPAGRTAEEVARSGVVTPFAAPLFREYLLAFEITSILLLTAIVGAVVLARRAD